MIQHKYDVIYILDPNATTEEGTAVSSKVEQIVADAKGTILKKDDWGKRRLAYAVKKHREGHYVFYHVAVSPETVAEITRNLRLLEKVIKFSIVKDEISHLKAKVKPPRVKASTAEGSQPRPGSSRPSNPTHKAPESSSHSAGSATPLEGPAQAASSTPAHSTGSPQASSGHSNP